jgi:class 3 adenylate cyclase
MAEDRQQRRLATILAADVFGYSRLTAENEEDALRTLKAHRAVIDRLIERHEGRIFNTAGDSVLAEFGSAVEAVRCAITIQEELRVRNAQIDEKRRMDFRIGINVGDVLVDRNNLYGDGVNIAARLESIAAPGSICISGSVFALVKNKLSYGFEDIGLQTMKNIPEPVPAFRLAPSPITKQVPSAAKSVRNWGLPIATTVAVVAIAGAGIFYSSERGKDRIAVPVAAPPGASAPPSLPTSPTAPAAPTPEPFVPAFTTQILKTEPAIGQLPTGATVLIDDGTCPTGQIKKIVGGNVTTGQPRVRSCVPRAVDAPPVAAPPATPALPASTPPQLDAAALERMRPYVGNSVEGISIGTGKPFVMTLKADGEAEVKIELATAGFSMDRGTWWIEPNGHFCVRYVRFAGGNLVCRALVVEGGGVKAYTWDHRPNPWVFKK